MILTILPVQAQCEDAKVVIKTRIKVARPSNSRMNVKVRSAITPVLFVIKNNTSERQLIIGYGV